MDDKSIVKRPFDVSNKQAARKKAKRYLIDEGRIGKIIDYIKE